MSTLDQRLPASQREQFSEAIVLLAVAHRSLPEAVFVEAFASDSAAAWGGWPRLRLLLSRYLTGEGEHLRLRSSAIQRAIQRRYLRSEERLRQARERLIGALMQVARTTEALQELSAQLTALEGWERLISVLGEPGVPASIDRAILIQVWQPLLAKGVDPRQVYEALLRDPEEDPESAARVADLLTATGDRDVASLWLRVADTFMRSGDAARSVECLAGGAVCLQSSNPSWALQLHEQAERQFAELGRKDGVAASLIHQVDCLRRLWRLAEASERADRQISLARQLGDPVLVSGGVGAKAVVVLLKGEVDAAIELFTEEERLARSTGDLVGLGGSLENQSRAWRFKEDWGRVAACLKGAQIAYRRAGNLPGLARVQSERALFDVELKFLRKK